MSARRIPGSMLLTGPSVRERPSKRIDSKQENAIHITLANGNAYDLHSRLPPHLREIASARLERRGQRPGPDTLGRWWELLRPDRPEPTERFAPGIPEHELRELVADLERI